MSRPSATDVPYDREMAREVRVVGAAPVVPLASRLDTLEDVVRTGWDLVDVIVQDEFTHDVIVRGPHAAFLVFDTT